MDREKLQYRFLVCVLGRWELPSWQKLQLPFGFNLFYVQIQNLTFGLNLMIHAMTYETTSIYVDALSCENITIIIITQTSTCNQGREKISSTKNGGEESGHPRRWCCRSQPCKNYTTSSQRHPYWSVSSLFLFVAAIPWSLCSSIHVIFYV